MKRLLSILIVLLPSTCWGEEWVTTHSMFFDGKWSVFAQAPNRSHGVRAIFTANPELSIGAKVEFKGDEQVVDGENRITEPGMQVITQGAEMQLFSTSVRTLAQNAQSIGLSTSGLLMKVAACVISSQYDANKGLYAQVVADSIYPESSAYFIKVYSEDPLWPGFYQIVGAVGFERSGSKTIPLLYHRFAVPLNL